MAEESNDASSIYIYIHYQEAISLWRRGGTDAYYARPKDAAQ